MKKLLSTTLIVATLFVNTSSIFAQQNYVHTTTTTENYSAASPVGKFENYSNTGNGVPVTTYYNANPVVQPTTIAYTAPYSAVYTTPVYSAGVTDYSNSNYNQAYNSQDIQTPQTYTKTTTTTDEYVDTREKADKVIDRGLKIMAGIAVVGAVAGLIIGACNK